MWLIYVICSIL
jgi:hypothetical protein